MKSYIFIFVLFSCLCYSSGRIHTVNLKSISRDTVTLSSFGFLRGGRLSVNISNFTLKVQKSQDIHNVRQSTFALVLEVQHKGAKVELWAKDDGCNFSSQNISAVYFWIKPNSDRININRSSTLSALHLMPYADPRNHTDSYNANYTLKELQRVSAKPGRPFEFSMVIDHDKFVGYYILSLHKCDESSKSVFDLQARIEENNNGNYLSAGNMAEPTMCFFLSFVFFSLGVFWMTVLKKSEVVYKMHYLMLAVVWVKCLSLLFHGINLHYVSLKGQHEEAWAIMYYVAYLMKVSLLFVTIILIGSGWAFIKHVLTQREKKLFIIFIPLQVLDNVAFIIMEESEVTFRDFLIWKQVFIIVDLICCIVIMLPIYWSIRHLQQAAGTDGKSALNLNKLKLFRHFYIIVVAYIYCTRIIKVLLLMSLPFYMTWVADLLRELAILTFFVLTGSKFRPASDNPYLMVPQDDDDQDIEMDEVVVGKSGVLDTVVRLPNRESDTVAMKRESSHEYD